MDWRSNRRGLVRRTCREKIIVDGGVSWNFHCHEMPIHGVKMTSGRSGKLQFRAVKFGIKGATIDVRCIVQGALSDRSA